MNSFILGAFAALFAIQIINSIIFISLELSGKGEYERVSPWINATIAIGIAYMARFVFDVIKYLRIKRMERKCCFACGSKNIRAWYGDRSVWSECRDCKRRAAKAYGSAKHRALVQEQVKSWNKK